MNALLAICFLLYCVGLAYLTRQQHYFARYLWGSLGASTLAIAFVLINRLDLVLGLIEGTHVQWLASQLGIETEIIGQTLLFIPIPEGHAGLRISVECSIYIEASLLISLLIFYNPLAWQQRIKFAFFGLCALYALNLLRLLLLIHMLHSNGMAIFAFAHGFVARSIFFFGLLFIYWLSISRATLTFMQEQVSRQATLEV